MRNGWVKIAQNTQLLKILSKALYIAYPPKCINHDKCEDRFYALYPPKRTNHEKCEQILYTILYGELQVGKRSHGGQKKRHKDILKASL